ncbi:MAG: 4Fe-4S ferredoxin, partial [Euryarchaeota archaeon]|nr:4Fe-4S ferredoxin [Euryarchaeota archaeon]
RQDNIALAECICRRKQHLLGHECAHPHETCIRFGVLADYFVENGAGRRIGMDECLRIIDRAEEECLVLMTTNCEEIFNVCSCCSCCCAVLKSLKALPEPAKYTVSSFQARIDPVLCKHCNTCFKRCQMDAVIRGEDYNSIDGSRCIGCGLCAARCPASAITLKARPGVVAPPLNVAERNTRILEERGLR